MHGLVLTWQFISVSPWARQFLNDLSQSCVATFVIKSGGICNNHHIAHLPMSPSVKELLWKSESIWWSYRQTWAYRPTAPLFPSHGDIGSQNFSRCEKMLEVFYQYTKFCETKFSIKEDIMGRSCTSNSTLIGEGGGNRIPQMFKILSK